MAGGTLIDAIQGPADRLGRYFSVLSVLPSAVLVLYVRLLAATGAWTGPPDWSAALRALAGIGLTESLQLVLVSLLVGLVLQPLQYAFVQFCEGYWGLGRLAQRVTVAKVRSHRRRLLQLEEHSTESGVLLRSTPRLDEARVVHLNRRGEAERLRVNYPIDPDDVRPTRLGNVLRRYESGAGGPYGLSLVTVAPHLVLSAPRTHVDYVEDQRTQLDLAIRLVVINAVACVLSVGCLWDDGLWLLVALVPYVLGYLCYRGSVVVAAEYGTALATVLDLDRFELYERLHLPLPGSTSDERRSNTMLGRVLRDRDEDAVLRYRHPVPPPADGA